MMFVLLLPQALPIQGVDMGNDFLFAGAEFIASY